MRIGKLIEPSTGTSMAQGDLLYYQPAVAATYDSYTKLLCHFDVVKATSVLAATGQTITYVNTADCQTTEKKWTGSLLLDGNSDYVTVPDSDDWNFGASPFTIDFWIYFNTVAQTRICGQDTTEDNPSQYINWESNKLTFVAYTTDYVIYFGCPWVPEVDTWYHVAVVRVNTDNAATGWRMFIDGVPGTLTKIGGAWNATLLDIAGSYKIGAIFNSTYLDGYIDEFRISKGIARWTDDFSASLPAVPYPYAGGAGGQIAAIAPGWEILSIGTAGQSLKVATDKPGWV
jgi:hypothetical protein